MAHDASSIPATDIPEHLTKLNLLQRYNEVRQFTHKLCEPLVTEDYVIQSMPDVSPTKWHLAHTSWFFEEFVLKQAGNGYKSIDDKYNYLFNSYYVQVGERWSRPHRGLLSRPTVTDIMEYRHYVDEHMLKFFDTADEEKVNEIAVVIEIGLNHEQQHQELLLTDIKHVLSINPLHPVYRKAEPKQGDIENIKWIEFEGGVNKIGHEGDSFFYDNEQPRHKTHLIDFAIANRLVTNKEYIDFIEDGGYGNVPLWLSDGIATVESEGWKAPLYWEKKDGEWHHFTLNGFRKVNPDEPVSHVSFYEADAYANWADARLATEHEWETASRQVKIEGNFVDNENYNPVPLQSNGTGIRQMMGDVWEWTRSDYAPYPGYKAPEGAIGEYNGKFMSGQYVLRGGSCATSKSHIRKTYRNFFYPHQRWQFTGIRLAKDV